MKKDRILYYDLLNILACLCVLYMHCNGEAHFFRNDIIWKESVIVETMAYWAVPMFFMLSGATLMNYRERYNTPTYLKHRFLKIGVPFIAWSLLSFVWKVNKKKIVFEGSIAVLISDILNIQIENVYWFFIPLFAVYLCIPVFSLIKDNRRIIEYMIIVAFITCSVLPTLFQLLGMKYNYGLQPPIVGGYVLYVLLGYYLSNIIISRRKRILIYILSILSLLLRYISVILGSLKKGELYDVFGGYLNFPVVILSIGLFLLFKNIKWSAVINKKIVITFISRLASASFGIYLMHMFVVDWFIEHNVNIYGLKWRCLGAPLIYLICFLIVTTIKKVPVVNKILLP